MKANEFLIEASIIDKLKKKAPPERIEPTFNAPAAPTRKSKKPRNPGKNAFGQMTSQLSTPKPTAPAVPAGQQAFNQMAAQVTPQPKPMKATKRNTNTAVGAQTKKTGGSPEFKAAQAQIQQNTRAQRNLTKQQQAKKTGVSYNYNQVPQPQTTIGTPSIPGLDQTRLTKAVVSSIEEITDPTLLKSIAAIISKKLKTPIQP
jgi:hypothetical protein